MDIGLEKLIKDIRQEDVVLFIGSGFSLKAGAPSMNDIINEIVKNASSKFLDAIPENERTLRKISEAYIKECNGRNELIRILNDIFQFTPKDLSNQEALYKIPHFKTIFTTNYDTLIEDIYPKSERIVVTRNESCPYTDSKQTIIYKLHGDINTLNDPDSIVISENDYKKYFTTKKFKLLCSALERAFVEKHVLFIGYSLEDEDILKLIKTVRNLVKKNMKGMYLVAPNLSKEKNVKLKNNSVTYIDACADEVLNTIISELNENVVKDYQQKRLSQETFELFCSRNGNLNTTTTHLKNENRIEKINVEEGHKKKEQIKFAIPKIKKKEIEESLHNKIIMLENGTEISLPEYKIEPSLMKDFSYLVNDIKFLGKEDISLLKMTPVIDKIDVLFEMESIKFKEKIKASQYHKGQTMNIIAQAPICTFKISIEVNKNIQGHPQMTLNVEITDTYKNNDEAIKWITLLINMSKGDKFSINGLKFNKPNQQVINDLKKIKSYYEMIKQIEEKIDITFDNYNNYSKENAINTIYLYSYLFKKVLEIDMVKSPTLTFEIDTREKDSHSIEKFRDNELSMIRCEPLGNMVLNGHNFNIPYRSLIFRSCQTKEITELDKYRYRITMQEQSPSCMVFCTKEELGKRTLNSKKIVD